MAGFEVLARRLVEGGEEDRLPRMPATPEEARPGRGRGRRREGRGPAPGAQERGARPPRASSSSIRPRPGSTGPPRSVPGRSSIPRSSSRARRGWAPTARIYPHVHIMSSTIGARVKVLTSTVMEDTVLEDDVQVGPFSRFRPKTRVCAGAKVGNFVEMKNTVFGRGSKAQHLSYVGDSTVEEGVNVGAGTITCNYDGVSKNPTHIGAGAFIGSGTELVAPVKVGRGAYIAAGSTITKDVAAGALAVARARQVEKAGLGPGAGPEEERSRGDTSHETQRDPTVLQERPGRRLAGDLRHRQDRAGPW
ncbi:MAG: hypothetical protein M0C28_46470 [Candidatus Moduliflexus flocculans]|nr:hypothetical protein [Candidatus Moduliflexus flocculans]